ncbi:MAG: NAD(+) synthase [Flavobacteriales bacterium]|jgi:NAD+ synthase|tara:strand:+ start:18486 stop:19271 length:786 start_codon:yes stop_codon:yes gene_type:complete
MNSSKISKNIIDWLKKYIENSKTKGFVIGVSGGIDSALASTLCANTGLPTLCLDMPIFQNENEQNRATNHIKWLSSNFNNVSSKTIDLGMTFDSFIDSIEGSNKTHNLLSLANSRSRLRMTTLYYFASLNNNLVVGTGNKVEDFGIGFYTKYGDGGVDISPIADLYKTEVFELAKYLKINNEILVAKPTDGLWDDERTDEDQIGASYNELEWAMKQKELGKNSLEFKGREKEVYDILSKLNKQNLHKMNPIPIYLVPEELR